MQPASLLPIQITSPSLPKRRALHIGHQRARYVGNHLTQQTIEAVYVHLPMLHDHADYCIIVSNMDPDAETSSTWMFKNYVSVSGIWVTREVISLHTGQNSVDVFAPYHAVVPYVRVRGILCNCTWSTPPHVPLCMSGQISEVLKMPKPDHYVQYGTLWKERCISKAMRRSSAD